MMIVCAILGVGLCVAGGYAIYAGVAAIIGGIGLLVASIKKG